MTIATEFLRSINLSADLEHPERLAHFHPTTKSLCVLEAVAYGRPSSATMVIAAYGSGKSLASGIGALLVDNRPSARRALAPVLRRLECVDRGAAERAKRRIKSRSKGFVIPLHGYVPNIATTLLKLARIRTRNVFALDKALNLLVSKAQRLGFDQISIIWDEFGRHLEGLVTDGRAAELMVVQELAEWAVRQNAPRATLTLLLHQSLLNYANRLNQSARYGWRKIEGRFEVLRFVEDSRELYRLIAQIVADARSQTSTSKRPSAAQLASSARRALKLGWFESFADANALKAVLSDAWPLTPAALYVLPLLAARVAQNERSLFTFLNQIELTSPITLENVYAYFTEAMRCDTGVGGTHRRWLETESARSRANNQIEREILAATCLLQLGTGGERKRLTRSALVFAVATGTSYASKAVEKAIDDLLGRKLLLHRLRNDDVSIWHGADVDIRSRVEEEKARMRRDFDLLSFLSKECPAPFERPLRHNVEYNIGRYWEGCYILARDLIEMDGSHPVFVLQPGDDGRIVYVIAESRKEISAITKLAKTRMPEDPGFLLVVPKHPLEITDSALELAALIRLREDHDLIGTDPLVLPELNELTAVAREHLHRVLAQLTDLSRQTAHYFSQRESIRVLEGQPLSEVLSKLTDQRFPQTPRIVNEQVVRHRLTRPMVNARKKVIIGILEHTGSPALGFSGMTTADASIYRTVLEHTGLYREHNGVWGWAEPNELKHRDRALSKVWSILKTFFSQPAAKPKLVEKLVLQLIQPPFGLRRGVFPILFAAALRAFGKAIAVRRDGVYLTDILASEIEEICSEPQRFTVQVVALDEVTRSYLSGIVLEFSGDVPRPGEDLIRAAFDAISAWKAQLPGSALTTQQFDDYIRAFQIALRNCVDPMELLFERFPTIAGMDKHGPETLKAIGKMRRTLDGIIEGYTAQAIATIGRIFTVQLSEDNHNILKRVKAWADCFADGALPKDTLDLPSRGLLSRARDATNGRYTEASFARALSAMLLGKGFEKWDDRTNELFADALRRQVERIESAALEQEKPSPMIAPILQGRLKQLMTRLRVAVGEAKADQIIEHLRSKG